MPAGRSRVRLWLTLLGREAVRALLRHKLRSALNVLGIMVGIAAVVLVVAIGRAGSEQAEAELRKLGDNLVWVEAGSRNVNGVRTGNHGTTSLTLEDAFAIRDEVPEIKRLSPQVDGQLHVISSTRNWTARYRGVSPEYLQIKSWQIAEGVAFTADDVDQVANVCLIGRTTREQLFGAGEAVGQPIRIEGQPFIVIGVLKAKGQSGDGRDQDDTLMMPYTTAIQKLRGKGFGWLDDILCSADSPDHVDLAITHIVALMRQRHSIGEQGDDFNIRRPDAVIKASIETSHTFALLLVCIASISLLVGGIGIMNVMLASVTERTREIGLRLAVGATRGAVLLQFLAESIMLSLLGGLQGVALSLAGRFVISRSVGWPITIPPAALGLALGFSVAVGLGFGVYPARKAARLDPIEALRHE